MTRPMITPLLALFIGVVSLVGCGSSSKSSTSGDATSTTVAVTTTTATQPAGATTSSAAAGDSSCGNIAAKVKAHLTSPAVTKVQVTSGCTVVDVVTSLGPTDVTAAQAICDQAAQVAYTTGSSGISVYASTNRELATGVKDEPCIGDL